MNNVPNSIKHHVQIEMIIIILKDVLWDSIAVNDKNMDHRSRNTYQSLIHNFVPCSMVCVP